MLLSLLLTVNWFIPGSSVLQCKTVQYNTITYITQKTHITQHITQHNTYHIENKSHKITHITEKTHISHKITYNTYGKPPYSK